MKNRAYKNYIFDFYGTLVDILTDEKDPVLWDKTRPTISGLWGGMRARLLKGLC